MAANQYVYDGGADFSGGQNASQKPSRLPDNQYAAGINISNENGVPRPRWGMTQLDTLFGTTPVEIALRTFKLPRSLFESGKFQAVIPYTSGSSFYLLLVISGVIYAFNQDTLEVQIIPIAGGSLLDELRPRTNWSVAGKYLAIFDYPAYPVILEGLTARRADPDKNEIPISVMGAYNSTRLFIDNAANEYTAGDPTGTGFPDAPITFLEIETPADPFYGQIFQLPTDFNNNQITAMTFLPTADISTGIGPLIIGTRTMIFSVNAQNQRSTWEQGQFASVFIQNAGIAGPRAYTFVNSDLFFQSSDGQVRSASMSRDEQKQWSKTPISREVQNWLVSTDDSLWQYTVMAYFRNKVFVSANPYRVVVSTNSGLPTVDYASGGLAVLELDNVSNLTSKKPPAWAGLWTGVRPMDIVVNNNRCFIISKDNGVNAIYEIDPSITYDTVRGQRRDIVSTIYTKAYTFKSDGGELPFQNKQFNMIEFGLENIQGNFFLDVKYRPLQAPNFLDWRKFEYTAPWEICGIPTADTVNGIAKQSIRDLNLGSPLSEDNCNPITQEVYDEFRKVQLKLTFSGTYWEMDQFRIKALLLPQNETESVCEPFPEVPLHLDCNTDWNIPEVSLCPTK